MPSATAPSASVAPAQPGHAMYWSSPGIDFSSMGSVPAEAQAGVHYAATTHPLHFPVSRFYSYPLTATHLDPSDVVASYDLPGGSGSGARLSCRPIFTTCGSSLGINLETMVHHIDALGHTTVRPANDETYLALLHAYKMANRRSMHQSGLFEVPFGESSSLAVSDAWKGATGFDKAQWMAFAWASQVRQIGDTYANWQSCGSVLEDVSQIQFGRPVVR